MKLLVVGMGLRASVMLKELLVWEPDLDVAAVADPNPAAAKAALESVYTRQSRFFNSLEDALNAGNYDGVIIATRCNLHTGLAIQVMRLNLPMFLEKPVGISEEEIAALAEAERDYKAQAVCSFPLRVSPLCALAKSIVQSGKLGAVEQAQAVNNVPYGGVYYHNWYRDDSITGGLWLQKATHDVDYVTYLLGLRPTEVCAMDAKRVFGGGKPAGLKCEGCKENRSCPESPFVLETQRFEDVTGGYCCFAKDVGNQDSGSAILRYETGMHAVYTQNFYARKAAAKRGVRLLGTRATLEFDWYTGELSVFSHDLPAVERHSFDTGQMSHFGGDKVLAKSFLEVCRGGDSVAPLSAGILSARVCLRAEASSRTGKFLEI